MMHVCYFIVHIRIFKLFEIYPDVQYKVRIQFFLDGHLIAPKPVAN